MMKSTKPLTKTQYGLYVECMAHQGEVCYNIPYCYTLDGRLDEERLRKAVLTAVAAHPTLFTRIELTTDGEPGRPLTTRRPSICRWNILQWAMPPPSCNPSTC